MTARPGSDAARRMGCRCPVADNHHGAGFPMGADRVWWVAQDCPLHASELDAGRDVSPFHDEGPI